LPRHLGTDTGADAGRVEEQGRKTDDRRPTTDARRPTTDDRRPTTDDRMAVNG
jgi:hypothetical protein